MTINTEGYLLAISSLSVALLGTLIRKGTLSEQQISELTDSAELHLSQLPRSIMSVAAGDYARKALQQVLDGCRQKPDS
jgi:hypothetical protein